MFGEAGEFLHCNAAGRDILKIIGYDGVRPPEPPDEFMQILRFNGGHKGEMSVTLGGQVYIPSQVSFEDGVLLRLMPVQESDHYARLSSSLDVMPWGLMTADLSGDRWVTVFANQKAGEFFRMPVTTMAGKPVTGILHGFGIEEELSARLSGEDITHIDCEKEADGHVRWFRFYFIPYKRRKPYCLIVVEDTTEAKVMEGQYFQAQRLEALGQLAGGVAHDFNNILSIIDGYARIAKKSVQGNTDALGYLDRITQSVQRGASLTEQLLTFGRHKVMKDMVADLGELVKDQEALIRPLMDASVDLIIQAEKNIPVDVPPDNICQILLNLCINARDAMQDGGQVRIGVEKDGEHAFLRVTDTGKGIAPEIQAKIFDPFFTTKDKGKGTGLGLSMVYGLVQDMRGEITVESEEGKGSCFIIRLPLSRNTPETHPVDTGGSGNVRLSGFTALIAEDEPDLLDIVSGMLEEMGAHVLKATNGNEALAMQEGYEGDIDFLLTDVVMPELNGVKLAECFEAVRPDSKVLFMSGYPSNGQMARVALPKDAMFVSKPVDFEKLGEAIKGMVREQDGALQDRWKVLSGQWQPG